MSPTLEQTSLLVDTSIYSTPSLFRACYKFTDLAYIFLSHPPDSPHLIAISFTAKHSGDDLQRVVQEFGNELIDQNTREFLERQFGPIRDLIVAHAFAEGNLLEPTTLPTLDDDSNEAD
jgi:His-Xaa-Ser system protein HxsD